MNYLYIWIALFVYMLFLILSYIFMIKRLKYLNDKHIEYTKVICLADLYKELKNRILILLFTLYIIWTFIILTFF